MEKITITQFNEATNNYLGWCTYCRGFTRGSTEPDAEEYHCPLCERETVMGAEQALVYNQITLIEDSYEL